MCDAAEAELVGGVDEQRRGRTRGSGPKTTCPPYSSSSETPMAVISDVRRGACAAGGSAKRSIRKPSARRPAMEHERHRQGAAPAPAAVSRVHSERGVVADERAEHEDVAVREVDQLQDAVDHRVAERDQGVDGAERHPFTMCWKKSVTKADYFRVLARGRPELAGGGGRLRRALRTAHRRHLGWRGSAPGAGLGAVSLGLLRPLRVGSGARRLRRVGLGDSLGLDAAGERTCRPCPPSAPPPASPALRFSSMVMSPVTPWKSLVCGERVAHGRGRRARSRASSRRRASRRVVGRGGERSGTWPPNSFLYFGHELLDARARVVDRVVVREVAALERRAADLVAASASPSRRRRAAAR